MNYSNRAKKRTLILCAFFMLSCTPDKTSTHILSPPDMQSKEAVPLLSLQELMNASDVTFGLSQAAKKKDKDALVYWQNELLEAADEVNLLASERKLIAGQQGLIFLEFQGMKTNYKQEFEAAFFDFGDVEAVYAKYPAFENAHAQSRELVLKRDQLINTVAKELTRQSFDGDVLQEAQRQWQNYASNNMREDLQNNLN